MKKKGLCDKFNDSLKDIPVRVDTYIDILEYLKSNKLAQMRWNDISESPDRDKFVRFLTKYVDRKIDDGRKKAIVYKAIIATLVGAIGIGAVGYALNSFNKEADDYYKNKYGPHGYQNEAVDGNNTIDISYEGNSSLIIKLNNNDQYYSGSVIIIRDVNTGFMKVCSVVDASKPLSVIVNSGEYDIILNTLPNGDYCGNVFTVIVGENDIQEVNVVAGYQSKEDREKVYSKK